jgi:DNA polymerase-3 subunit delta'
MSEPAHDCGHPELFPWQKDSWKQLSKYAETGRVPQALLVSGIAGVGKNNLASCFAANLLCTAGGPSVVSCGVCAGCRFVRAGTHPDLIRIEPSETGKVIPVDTIRGLVARLALTPQYRGFRVIILQPADRLNTAAANALLKTLEEPVEQTVFILLSSRSWDLPATIRSRCQRLKVPVPSACEVVDWLTIKKGVGDAELLFRLAGGSPLKAAQMAHEGVLSQRQVLYSFWRQVADGSADPVRVAAKLAGLGLENVIDWVGGWIVDMIRLRMVPTARILRNPDLRSSLQVEVERLDLKQLFGFYDRLGQSSLALNTTVNPTMLLENVLIDWGRLERE